MPGKWAKPTKKQMAARLYREFANVLDPGISAQEKAERDALLTKWGAPPKHVEPLTESDSGVVFTDGSEVEF